MAKTKRRARSRGNARRNRRSNGQFVKGNRGARRNARKNARRTAKRNAPRRNKRRNPAAGSPAAKRGGRKAAATRKRNAAKRSAAAKKGARKRKARGNRQTAPRKNSPRRNKRRRNTAKRNSPRRNRRRTAQRNSPRKNRARRNTAKRNSPRRNRRRTAKRNAPRRNRRRNSAKRNSPRRNRGVSGRRNSPRRNRGIARRNQGEGSLSVLPGGTPRILKPILTPVKNVLRSITKALSGSTPTHHAGAALIGFAGGALIPELLQTISPAAFTAAFASQRLLNKDADGKLAVNDKGAYVNPLRQVSKDPSALDYARRYFGPMAGATVTFGLVGAIAGRLKMRWGPTLLYSAMAAGFARGALNLLSDFLVGPLLGTLQENKAVADGTSKALKVLAQAATLTKGPAAATGVPGWGVGALVRSAQLPGSLPMSDDALSVFRNFGASGRGVRGGVIKSDYERALNM